MLASSVQIHATRPARFDRVQLVLRLLIFCFLGAVGLPVWPFNLLYIALPLVAAVLLSSRPSGRFITDSAPAIAGALGWLLGVLAYFSLVVDRLPGGDEPRVRITITPGGTPTTGSALIRLLTSVPSALVLCLLGAISTVIFVIAAVCILVSMTYPASLWEFQLAVLRWHARLYAYHGSLVGEYPPFTFDTSHEDTAPAVGEPPSHSSRA